jgi:polyphosphate kinase 2 (PPK2 family)
MAKADKGEKKLGKAEYLEKLGALELELDTVARWLQHTGKRLVVLLEGRDTAGKGGVISAIADTLNPRQCRVVALPKPSERERTQWYFQRYVAHLPAAGEIVLMDRSWYNRAGVERVMGYCTEAEAQASSSRRRCSRRCSSTTASCCTSTGSPSTRTSRRSVSPSV